MTHTATLHTHDPDPPVSKWHPYSKWTRTIVDRLVELHLTLSSRKIAVQLSQEFGIPFTRGSVIGKLNRLGLTEGDKKEPASRAPKPARTYPVNRPTLRIVRVNGNSPGLKVTQSVETDLPLLRCVPVEPRHLTLLELGPDDCRFPYGDGPFTHCGHKIFQRSLCKQHFELCWIAPTPRNQAARGWK